MATVYDQISELNEMCRKLETMNLAELSVPMRAKIAELAVPTVPMVPVVDPEPEPHPEPQPEPAAPQRRAKRSMETLLDLYRRGLLNNDEVCYLRTFGHEDRYRIRFTNNTVLFFYPPETKEFSSPAAVAMHHASQIYEGHPRPTKPGNGWIYIKLLDRDNKTLSEYCDMHTV